MLGAFFEQRTGVSSSVGQTDCETVFDRPDCVVRNWPGVTDGQELQQAWDLMTEVGDTITRKEFERELFGLCAEQFAWVEEMLNHDVPLAGVHIHTLDAAGHAYCENEPALRAVYERVAEFVGRLRRSLSPADELLILSDHGMTVSFYSDEHDINTPGNHSWRAFSSTTTGPRPDEIGELPKWVDSNIRATSTTDDASTLSIPDEQLRQLGYIE
jgi:predicted AlkP superfamily pyrophosphatase or phosphodiesterase